MISVGIVLLVQDVTGSFTLAGSATGTFAIFSVAAGPVRSWFTVRWGHRLTLLILSLVEALSLVALTVAVTREWPSWQILAFTAVIGAASPPFGALMRVGWSHALPESARPKAFGVDSVCEEMTLMVGPLLVGATVAVAGTQVSLLISSGLCVVGAVTMAVGAPSARVSNDTSKEHASMRSVVRSTASVFLALVAVGLTVGMIEVGVPALSEEFDRVALAGPLLAVLSAASACGAFVYSRIAGRAPLHRWMMWLSASAALGTALLAAAVDLLTVFPLLVIAGLAVGPAVMTGFLMADHAAEGHTGKTHAAILAGVACNGGTAMGAALSGVLIGSTGPHVAFLIIGGVAALGVAASRLVPLSKPSLGERTKPTE